MGLKVKERIIGKKKSWGCCYLSTTKVRLLLTEIFDKNLFGIEFLVDSLLYLIIGIIIEYLAFYRSNILLLFIFSISYIGIILLTGLFSKNFKFQFHPINRLLSILIFYTSIFSLGFAFIYNFEDSIYGLSQRFLLATISEIVLISSLISIVVLSQRNSLRKSLGLNTNLLDTEKERWKNELQRFPNLDKVLEGFDTGKSIEELFYAGYFNLAVLWSCNIMEEIIDSITDGIITIHPEKTSLFRNKEGRQLPYPTQLKNLGYVINKESEQKEISLDALWHELRNKIAHHNYRPTFYETSQTIKFTVTFLKQMPLTLKNWI